MNDGFGLRRSAFLGLALLGVLVNSPAAAQQSGKTYRIGIITGSTLANNSPNLVAFRHTLSGLGYQEGKNLEIDFRGAGGNFTQLPGLVAGLLGAKPDVIVAAGSPAIAAAKRATTSVPIVMVNVVDPVGFGFVASLARPGGNVTGTTNVEAELEGKRLQLLKELVPGLRRVAVLRNPDNPSSPSTWREAERGARTLGMQALAVDIRSRNQIDAAFKTIQRLRAGAILALADSVTGANIARVARLGTELRLPTISGPGPVPAAGVLMSYAPSLTGMWSQAALYVDRILKGAKPADLPVERPTTFELVVNLKTARALGIAVPQSILLQATQVIR